ncbi:DUF5013 domain-containing protein [uncultured Bacteroides sp.]|uniref:DUF5013 domain-containing protein n=1 Tax=uncultured Bacteroides sp. TaxID=162156 RepID=UPI0025D1D55E|nr:DUF5013 domain-containing protein [uncultured Bacteroides sp.]
MKQLLNKNRYFLLFACLMAILNSCKEGDGEYRTYIYPAPEVTSISPVNGFIGSSVSVFGTNFGQYADAVKVFFGEIEAKTILSVKNNCIVVKVPEEATSGEMSLQVWTNTTSAGKFTVVPKPSVTSMVSSNTEYGSMAAVGGDKVTIVGTGFDKFADETTVEFSGISVGIDDITETEITVTAPQNYETGKVTVTVNGLSLVAGAMLNPTRKGDISAAFLENYQQPFLADPNMTQKQIGTKLDWATPAGWIVNEAAANGLNAGATENCGGLRFDKDANGHLLLQAGWSFPGFTNGKLYQVVTLPKGNYRLTLSLFEVGVKSGSKFYLAATKGAEMLDADNLISDGATLGCYTFLGNEGANDVYTDFVLNETTEVSLGLSGTFIANTWFRATAIKLEYR